MSCKNKGFASAFSFAIDSSLSSFPGLLNTVKVASNCNLWHGVLESTLSAVLLLSKLRFAVCESLNTSVVRTFGTCLATPQSWFTISESIVIHCLIHRTIAKSHCLTTGEKFPMSFESTQPALQLASSLPNRAIVCIRWSSRCDQFG